MGAARKKKSDEGSVEAKLMTRHYEDLLADFREQMEDARAILREYQEAMRRGIKDTADR